MNMKTLGSSSEQLLCCILRFVSDVYYFSGRKEIFDCSIKPRVRKRRQ